MQLSNMDGNSTGSDVSCFTLSTSAESLELECTLLPAARNGDSEALRALFDQVKHGTVVLDINYKGQ